MPIYVATTGEGKPSLISEGIFDKVIISGLGLYATGADQYVSISSGVCVNEKNVHTISAGKVAAQSTGSAYTGYVVVDADGNLKHTANPDSTHLPIGKTSVDATGVVTSVEEINRGVTNIQTSGSYGTILTGTLNTVYGYEAGTNLTSGNYNTLIGSYAGEGVTSGYGNVFLGANAGQHCETAAYNICIGLSAGQGTVSTLGYGDSNIFIGYSSGNAIESGHDNIGIGKESLFSITTGYQNIAIGTGALTKCTTGYSNVGIGLNACGGLGTGVTGYNNVCIGDNSGCYLENGYDNVIIGTNVGSNATYSLSGVVGVTCINSSNASAGGSYQVVIGCGAGSFGGGYKAILIGYQAGAQNNGKNILIGDQTGYYNLNKSGQIAIGLTYLTGGIPNNALAIETQYAYISNCLIYGNFLNRYLRIGGAFGQYVKNIAAGTAATTYDMTGGEGIILADASSADLTIVLPSAPWAGLCYPIKRIDTSTTTTLTIQPASTSQSIDGAASITLAAGDKVKLVFDGSNWYTIV